MKIAVIGSRTFLNYRVLSKVLEQETDIELIISGGARGADSLAKRYAEENNIPIKEHLPLWDIYGKSAGYRRNIDIVKEADKVIAFWDSKSTGTKNSIDLAKKLNKELKIIYF